MLQVGEDEQERRTRAIVSQETANILSGLGILNLLVKSGIYVLHVDRFCKNKILEEEKELSGGKKKEERQ